MTPPNNQFDSAPDELKARAQWVTWKYNRHGRKLPCSTATGDVADAHDPASWGTFAQAVAACRKRKHAGIGFDFTANDPYTGVDLDDCIREDGTLAPVAAAIIADLDTYTEISPSGNGVKMWVRGTVSESVTPTDIGDGVKIEMYSVGRFFTVTGQRLPDTSAEIRTVGTELTSLYDRVKPPAPPQSDRSKALPQAATDANHIRRWCLAALEGEQQKMQDAGDGERHKRRYASAHALGGLVHTGGVTRQEIFDALAINFGRDRRGAEATIWDGIAAGDERPRIIPEPSQPTFDTLGHACCPTHGKRLIACRNGNGYRCSILNGNALCFWWQGEGYTPPAEVTTDNLDDLDPDTLRQQLRVVMAERDQWKQKAEHLEGWRAWALQVASLPTEQVSPAAKVVALSLWPELKSRESGGVTEPRPIYIGGGTDTEGNAQTGAKDKAGLSASTYGAKLKELANVGAIARQVVRDPRTGHSKVLIQPIEFDQPAAWVPPEARNQGGTRPGAGRPLPHCDTCPPETPVVEEVITTAVYQCEGCGKPIAHHERGRTTRRWKPDNQSECWTCEPVSSEGDDPNTQVALQEKTEDLSPVTQIDGRVLWQTPTDNQNDCRVPSPPPTASELIARLRALPAAAGGAV